MDTNYFWTLYSEDENGDNCREQPLQGDDIRDYTVTEASNADILAACGLDPKGDYNVVRDYDGRAYITQGEDLAGIYQIESSEVCSKCGYALEGCEGACSCSACGAPLSEGGDDYMDLCATCADKNEGPKDKN